MESSLFYLFHQWKILAVRPLEMWFFFCFLHIPVQLKLVCSHPIQPSWLHSWQEVVCNSTAKRLESWELSPGRSCQDHRVNTADGVLSAYWMDISLLLCVLQCMFRTSQKVHDSINFLISDDGTQLRKKELLRPIGIFQGVWAPAILTRTVPIWPHGAQKVY